MSAYPGVREQVDYWLHCVESVANADVYGAETEYARVLDLQTKRMFDNEPVVLLLASLEGE